MYGGVSLAIYINGVAHEFFRLVRGRGVYRLIKALTSSDAVVDIVSGSSAGGINGILLSYALCNGREFSACAKLWRESGDIAKLLRNPSKDKSQSSVLDGDGYYQRELEQAFDAMERIDRTVSEKEDPSSIGELDLFVTGTDLAGNVYTLVDDAGHIIDVKDHRAVFMLQHREGRKEHFKESPTTNEALARLARITSCFPAAFPPVEVQARDELYGDFAALDADARIQLWGQLQGTRIFVDGGVLDNKPFTQTIEAIFFRTANRAVDRKLFYVEPDPERFEQTLEAPKLNFLKPVVDSLVGIPGYESIADDLRLLQERNSGIRRFKALAHEARDNLADVGGRHAMASAGIPQDLKQPLLSIYERSRLNSINERAIELLLRGQKGRTLSPAERKAVSSLAKVLADLPEASDIFEAFDLDFRLRRLFQSIYTVFEDPKLRDAGLGLLEALNRQLHLLKMLQWAAQGAVEHVSEKWYATLGTAVDPKRHAEETWTLIRKALQHVLNGKGVEDVLPEDLVDKADSKSDEWLPEQTLKKLRNTLLKRLGNLDAVLEAESWEEFESLLQRTDGYERGLWTRLRPAEDSALSKQYKGLTEEYERFAYLDAYLFPMEFASGVREKDIIETVRISPVDAQARFSHREAGEKISGDALAHFGGFFKKAWRSNDILWGRLDALCELTEQLLTTDRIREVVHNDELRKELRSEFGQDRVAYVEMIFPSLEGGSKQRIADWLGDLASDDSAKREEAAADVENMRGLFIECGQHEVLSTDLEKVWLDDARERFDWKKPGHELEGGLVALGKTIDKIQQANETVAYERPMKSVLGRYFTDEYKVGSEDLFGSVHRLVLLETAARAGLVLEHCLASMLPSEVLTYRTVLRLPLKVLYNLIGFLRRSGRFGAALFGLGLVGVVLPIVFWWFANADWRIAGPVAAVSLILLLLLGILGRLKNREA